MLLLLLDSLITQVIEISANKLNYKKYFLFYIYVSKEINIKSILHLIHMKYEYSEELPGYGWIIEYLNDYGELCKLKIDEMKAEINNDVNNVATDLKVLFQKLCELTGGYIHEESKFVI